LDANNVEGRLTTAKKDDPSMGITGNDGAASEEDVLERLPSNDDANQIEGNEEQSKA